MDRHAIDGAGVDHDGEGTGTYGSQIGSEMLFAQVVRRDDGWGTVLATDRNAIAHVVLHADSDVVGINVVGVFTLEAKHHGLTHFSTEVAVFAEVFPCTRPQGVAAEVERR